MIKIRKRWINIVLICIKNNVWYVITAFFFTITSAALSLSHRELTRIAINEMSNKLGWDKKVLLFGLLVVLIRVISYFELYAAGYIKLRYRNNIRVSFGKDIIYHLIGLPMKTLEGEKVGENVTRFTSDIDGIADLIDNVISSIGLFTFTFIGAAYLTFKIDWKIAVMSFFIIDPLTLILTKYYSPKIQENAKDERNSVATVTNEVSEIVQSVEFTKTYTLEKFLMGKYEKIALQLSNTRLKLFKTKTIASFLTGSIPEISTGLILIYGGWRVMQGTLKPGDIWALMNYTMIVHGRILQVTNIIFLFQKSVVQIEKIDEILCKKREDISGRLIPSKELVLRFKNVAFKYDKTEKNILDNVSFDLYPNDIVAVVGSSGAGKSTLAKVMIRLYDITKGNIEFCGTDIYGWNLNILRNVIGFVPQEPFLFNMSIYDNIVLDKTNVDKEDVIKAAEMVGIHDFILSLSDGYNTIIGFGGLNMSGGQKQRIALAREIIRNPSVLILDESTSAVDVATEKSVLNNIVYNFKDKIIILIAHRPDTIIYANRVLRIEDGKVINIK